MTAFTRGYSDGIVLYDTPNHSSLSSEDDLPLVLVASGVVAVELDSELKLAFDFSSEDLGCGFRLLKYGKIEGVCERS